MAIYGALGLSRRPARTERAKLRTAEVLAHLEG